MQKYMVLTCENNNQVLEHFDIYVIFRDFIDGHVENLMTELEIEKSLKHHEDIVDEIECLEKTLLKRRSELREADRLLAEAENELACTKEKVCLVCFRLAL